jgi:hypothetical protein
LVSSSPSVPRSLRGSSDCRFHYNCQPVQIARIVRRLRKGSLKPLKESVRLANSRNSLQPSPCCRSHNISPCESRGTLTPSLSHRRGEGGRRPGEGHRSISTARTLVTIDVLLTRVVLPFQPVESRVAGNGVGHHVFQADEGRRLRHLAPDGRFRQGRRRLQHVPFRGGWPGKNPFAAP